MISEQLISNSWKFDSKGNKRPEKGNIKKKTICNQNTGPEWRARPCFVNTSFPAMLNSGYFPLDTPCNYTGVKGMLHQLLWITKPEISCVASVLAIAHRTAGPAELTLSCRGRQGLSYAWWWTGSLRYERIFFMHGDSLALEINVGFQG